MADARYDGFDAIEVLDEVDSTNEELMIAKDTYELVTAMNK